MFDLQILEATFSLIASSRKLGCNCASLTKRTLLPFLSSEIFHDVGSYATPLHVGQLQSAAGATHVMAREIDKLQLHLRRLAVQGGLVASGLQKRL